MAEGVLYIVGRAIIPKWLRSSLRSHLLKAGYSDVPYSMFGMCFFIITAIAYAIFMGGFYPELKGYAWYKFFFLAFVTFSVITFLLVFSLGGILYFFWNIKIYHRTKQLELLLPDYLTLVSTNLKGGMSFENALWSAIKPEFGILANEIGLVSKRVMTGNDVTDALTEFALKYDSPIMRRNIQLMTSEIESGGKVVQTIDRIIYDMKKVQLLKKEMASSTLTYMIFIGMLVVFICPVLFALSLQLFTIISSFMGNISGTLSAGTVGGVNIGKSSIDTDDFRLFSILAISIISIFSSMIIATIEKGDLKSGLKYIPMFLVTSLLIYFIASYILNFAFGSIHFG